MKHVTLELSEKEILDLTTAYQAIQSLLEKVLSPSELYNEEFLKGLQEARSEVENNNEVK